MHPRSKVLTSTFLSRLKRTTNEASQRARFPAFTGRPTQVRHTHTHTCSFMRSRSRNSQPRNQSPFIHRSVHPPTSIERLSAYSSSHSFRPKIASLFMISATKQHLADVAIRMGATGHQRRGTQRSKSQHKQPRLLCTPLRHPRPSLSSLPPTSIFHSSKSQSRATRHSTPDTGKQHNTTQAAHHTPYVAEMACTGPPVAPYTGPLRQADVNEKSRDQH